jgi:hypothetical protein
MPTDQERERLATAKRRLWSTMSGMKYNNAPDTGTEIVYKDIATIIKLNQCKAELTATLQGRGAVDTTQESPITKNGVPFIGQQGSITAHGKNYLELIAEQQDTADNSPSPAVNGQGNWSPSDRQGAPFDADSAAADLLRLHTKKDGSVEKTAKRHFLHISGDGSDVSHYDNAVPLATVHPISQQPIVSGEAVDAAWKLVDGSTNGIADRAQQSRLIRLKKKNRIPLSPDQNDYVVRHNGATLMLDTDLDLE